MKTRNLSKWEKNAIALQTIQKLVPGTLDYYSRVLNLEDTSLALDWADESDLPTLAAMAWKYAYPLGEGSECVPSLYYIIGQELMEKFCDLPKGTTWSDLDRISDKMVKDSLNIHEFLETAEVPVPDWIAQMA